MIWPWICNIPTSIQYWRSHQPISLTESSADGTVLSSHFKRRVLNQQIKQWINAWPKDLENSNGKLVSEWRQKAFVCEGHGTQDLVLGPCCSLGGMYSRWAVLDNSTHGASCSSSMPSLHHGQHCSKLSWTPPSLIGPLYSNHQQILSSSLQDTSNPIRYIKA